MIRKQIYLQRDQNKKVKRIAAARGCTEAEVIRQAVDQIVEPGDAVLEKLRAEGLLVDTSDMDAPSGKELEKLERELDDWLVSRGRPLGLSQAVLDERAEGWRASCT
ncbi:MAG: CopG family transcriptional regulator [Chloroflexota bacterium]